jgi:hypothetical protein
MPTEPIKMTWGFARMAIRASMGVDKNPTQTELVHWSHTEEGRQTFPKGLTMEEAAAVLGAPADDLVP